MSAPPSQCGIWPQLPSSLPCEQRGRHYRKTTQQQCLWAGAGSGVPVGRTGLVLEPDGSQCKSLLYNPEPGQVSMCLSEPHHSPLQNKQNVTNPQGYFENWKPHIYTPRHFTGIPQTAALITMMYASSVSIWCKARGRRAGVPLVRREGMEMGIKVNVQNSISIIFIWSTVSFYLADTKIFLRVVLASYVSPNHFLWVVLSS